MISLAPTRGRIAALLATALAATTVAITAPTASAAEGNEPLLTALSIDGSRTVRPGEPITFEYSATDDGGPLRSIHVHYADTSYRQTYWSLGTDLGASGRVTVAVPQGLPNEGLRAQAVWITDSDGNSATFNRDGTWCTPTCFRTHEVDLSTLDVVMSGSTPDVAVPEVTHVSMDTPTIEVGGTVRATVTLTDAHPLTSLPVRSQAVLLASEYGDSFSLWTDPSGAGTLSGVVPAYLPNGVYTPRFVRARDAVGNAAEYHPNGNVTKSPSGATGPATHSLDLSTVKVTVSGSTFDGQPPRLTKLTLPNGSLATGSSVSIGVEGSDDLSGIASVSVDYTATIGDQVPSQWTLTAQMSGPGVAVGTVPSVSAGSWRPTMIKVTDKAGHYARYYPGGSVYCDRICPSQHSLDFTAFGATVITAPWSPNWVGATPSNGSVRVDWTEPAETGGSPVTGYTMTVIPGGKTYTTSASTRSLIVSGLTNNTSHTFEVRAVNAVGTSAARPVASVPRAFERFVGMPRGTGDSRADIVGVSKSHTAYLYRGTGTGTVLMPGITAASGLGSVRTVLPGTWAAGDNVWGTVLGVTYDGYLRSYTVGSTGKWYLRYSWLDRGYNQYKTVISPGDVTGDGRVDMLGITDSGDLHLRAARASTTPFAAPRKIGGGWSAFTTVTAVGDLNGDRRNDIVARKKDGTLWLYAGTGRGTFYGKQIGTSTSWKSFARITGVGDFTGDKRNDLLALAPNGYLYVYKGNGKGGFTGKSLVSKGFASFV